MTAFHPGDEVYGMVGGVGGLQGTFAEYVVADADLLALKPKSLSMREAAALPLIGITAWEGIIDRAKVHSGQKVLVHAGAGGVGHIAVQLAPHTPNTRSIMSAAKSPLLSTYCAQQRLTSVTSQGVSSAG